MRRLSKRSEAIKRRKGGEEVKRQWRQFLRRADKQRLYKSELSYGIVPWLAKFLAKSIRKGIKMETERILETLESKHGVTLDKGGNLCFVRFERKGVSEK